MILFAYYHFSCFMLKSLCQLVEKKENVSSLNVMGVIRMRRKIRKTNVARSHENVVLVTLCVS